MSARVLLSGVRHCITERPAHTGVHSRTHPLLLSLLSFCCSCPPRRRLALPLPPPPAPRPSLPLSSLHRHHHNRTKPSSQHIIIINRTIHNKRKRKRKSIITYLARLALSPTRLTSNPLSRKTRHIAIHSERESERAHLPLPIKRIDRSRDSRRTTKQTHEHDLTHKHKERTKEKERKRERAHRHSQRPHRCHSHVRTHTHTHTHTHKERARAVTQRRPPSRSDMPALLR